MTGPAAPLPLDWTQFLAEHWQREPLLLLRRQCVAELGSPSSSCGIDNVSPSASVARPKGGGSATRLDVVEKISRDSIVTIWHNPAVAGLAAALLFASVPPADCFV